MRKLTLLMVVLATAGCGLSDGLGNPERQPVAEPAPASDLTPPVLGTEWVAKTITGEPAAEGLQSWLQLSPDGTISGHAACNAFTGSYRIEGDRIYVQEPLVQTKVLCSGATMEEERRFMAAIESAARIEVVEHHLLLYPPDGGSPTELAPLAGPERGNAAIAGTVTYSTGKALPDDARLVVRLLDETEPGAPPQVLGSTIVDPAVAPPIPFSVAYQSDAVDPEGSYALEAAILVGDDELLHTVTDVPVLTGGHPADHVDLVVAAAN